MEWIKATDRLPDKSGCFYARDIKTGDKKVLWYRLNRNNHQCLFIRCPEKIEWLDEENKLLETELITK